MKSFLFIFVAAITGIWYFALPPSNLQTQIEWLSFIRQEGLLLTGVLSIALMSLCIFLSIRPAWLERPLGGLDRIYRWHKWAGILAVAFGVLHWLLKQSDELIENLFGIDTDSDEFEAGGVLGMLREVGDEIAEPALYLVLAMLAITLLRRIPYHIWRQLHRIMPLLYLLLAYHAAVMAPSGYWSQSVGVVIAVFIIAGSIASFWSLSGLIGRKRMTKGTVVSIKREGDVTEVVCKLEKPWKSHRPGQFAFLTFLSGKDASTAASPGLRLAILLHQYGGAHPFTIAGIEHTDQTIIFYIKSAGDFTDSLVQWVLPGQKVKIEGPYGRFQLERHSPKHHQIWVAGGIGITPFLAWLESLSRKAGNAKDIELHYCTKNRETDCFVSRLRVLCASVPGVTLHIHSSQHGERLTADKLCLANTLRRKAEVWYCGPSGLAEALKPGLRKSWKGNLNFHQEAFEMR